MSNSNRRSDIAFGRLVVGTFALVALLFGLAVLLGPNRGDPDAKDCQSRSDQTQSEPVSRFSPGGKNQTPTADKKPDSDKDDYCLQWRTAVATERQADYTAVGLLLILLTLLATSVAAVAARRTVRTMQETAERQLRAYVYVDEAKIIDFADAEKATIRILIKNAGQTPAHDVVQRIGRGTRLLNDTGAKPRIAEVDPAGTKMVINPGGAFPAQIVFGYSAEQMDVIRDGNVNFYVCGLIRYLDAFGKEQTSEFLMRYEKGSKKLAFCAEGNKAT